MPYTPMHEDLKERTKERILRTDSGIENNEAWESYEGKPKVVYGEDGKVLYVELQIRPKLYMYSQI